MATKKKMLQAAAGNAGGAGLDVEEVFSTYLYDGTGAAQTITNGIDLDGEGGLVWGKSRTDNGVHSLYDTERGVQKPLFSNTTNAQGADSGGGSTSGLYQFNSNGFNLGSDWAGNINVSGQDMVSWTFRKAPKFFDVVTYTGNGTSQTISHNLSVAPAVVITKRTDTTSNWLVYHTSISTQNIYLNNTSAAAGTMGITSVTDASYAVNGSSELNENGGTYVAYIFAHNDGDGEFGPDGDADIIKCGSVVADGSGNATVDLGFEPQWLMVKNATSSGYDWQIFDTMRGFKASPDNDSPALFANTSGAESGQGDPNITSTGFTWDGGGAAPNNTYIFMAIRRGTKVPESATEVFAISTATNTYDYQFQSNFPVDMALKRENNNTSDPHIGSRLTGSTRARTDSTDPFYSEAAWTWDYMDGYWTQAGSTNSNLYSWMWKRAPGYFDAVAYTGNSTAGRTVSHNLGVAPEMMWIKKRSGAYEWIVYSPAGDGYLRLNTTEAYATSNVLWNATSPTSTEFTLGGYTHVNGSGEDYIAYLFASLPGISKVGSYTGNGESVVQTIDCGFTSGARFVLIKKSSSTGNWIVYDAERGISTATSDGVLLLNSSNAESPESLFFAGNAMQPDSSGFKVTTDDLNRSGDTYIFYAIA